MINKNAYCKIEVVLTAVNYQTRTVDKDKLK